MNPRPQQKKLLFQQRSETPHWVGDGFPVRQIFNYNAIAREISPFLLMDYAGPTEFTPSVEHIRGVGEHPHRGFETVTIVYSGEVEHKDSAGGGGKIGPGDVQWMTAASGLVHEEKHGKDFAKNGGMFEMVQLWVNLPAKDKMSAPKYQGLRASDIPEVELSQGEGPLRTHSGKVRVIAGEYEGKKGPAKTFTPINVWDVRLNENAKHDFQMPLNHSTLVFVLSGKVQLGTGETIGEAELGVLESENQQFHLNALEETKLLILGGEPIKESIVGYGPFVMNTREEIAQAFEDFNNGRMGQLVS